MWRRCPGNLNLVDLSSWGTAETDFFILFSEWNSGSTFLHQSINTWPVDITITYLSISENNKVLNVVESVSSKDIKNSIDICKCSWADCMFRVTAFIWRFVPNLKLSVRRKESPCSVIYMHDCESHSFRSGTWYKCINVLFLQEELLFLWFLIILLVLKTKKLT